jgi:NitT/TauT family transport system ATP-binding protein
MVPSMPGVRYQDEEKQYSSGVEITELSKIYRSRLGTVHALDATSLSIPAGSFTALVGPSGCGKSTVLGLVAGLDRPTAGEVRIDSKPVSGPHPGLGVVFQRDLLLEWRSVFDNVLLQIDMRSLRRADFEARAKQLLDLVGLGQFMHQPPSALSGGMRQRVSICRALVHDPTVLLMDEPFGALDAITREQLNTELSALCSRDEKTVLFITHGISEAVFLADQVVVMSPRPGRVAGRVEIDAPKPRDPTFRQSATYTDGIAQVRSLLHEEGVL